MSKAALTQQFFELAVSNQQIVNKHQKAGANCNLLNIPVRLRSYQELLSTKTQILKGIVKSPRGNSSNAQATVDMQSALLAQEYSTKRT